MFKKSEKYISLKEAAKISGYHSDYIGYLIRKKRIKSRKIFGSSAWFVNIKDLFAYKEKRFENNKNFFEKETIKNRRNFRRNLIYDIFPPIQEKVSYWIKAFQLFLKTSKYAFVLIFFIIVICGALIVWAIPSEEPEALTTKIYPTQCQGGWENPQNAQGKPDLVKEDKSSFPPFAAARVAEGAGVEEFNEENSAILRNSISQIFCQGFEGEIPDDTEIKKVSLKFSWAFKKEIPEFFIPAPAPSEENLSPEEISPTEEEISPIPNPESGEESLPENPSSWRKIISFAFAQEEAPANKETEDQPAPEESTSQEEELTSQEAEEKPIEDITSDAFLEVFYTLDSVNWQSLGKVSRDNWQGLTLEVPISSWEDLEKLQISIQSLMVFDDQPTIYLDGLWLEVEYEKISEDEEEKTIDLYASLHSGDWQNPQNAAGQPEVGPNGDFNSFSDVNSAVYQPGPLNLVLSGFNHTQTDLETTIEKEEKSDEKIKTENEEQTETKNESFESDQTSFFERIKNFFTKGTVKVQEIPTFEELVNKNELVSAKIKFSFAIREKKIDLEPPKIEEPAQEIITPEETPIEIWYSFSRPEQFGPELTADGPVEGGETEVMEVGLPSIGWPEIWQKLDTISNVPLSNFLNGGYFEYDAPFLENWDDVKNLKIKFEGVVGRETVFTAYLDSVWVEAEIGTETENLPLVNKLDLSTDKIKEIKSISPKKVVVRIEKENKNELWLFNLESGKIRKMGFQDSSPANDFPVGLKGNFAFWLNEKKDTVFTYDLARKKFYQRPLPLFDQSKGERARVKFPKLSWEVIIGADDFYFFSKDTGEIFSDGNSEVLESFRQKFNLDSFLTKEELSNLGLSIEESVEESVEENEQEF